jgi:hypothetical protein
MYLSIALFARRRQMRESARQKTFWKYGFVNHMVENHLNEENELPFLDLELWATTHISKWEEMKMGIPQETTDHWRNSQQVLDSDDIQAIQAAAVDEDEGDTYEYSEDEGSGNETEEVEETWRSRKRGMSMQSTTSSRAASPKKKHQAS